MRAVDVVLTALVGLLVCAWSAPVVVMLADAWCWMMFDHQLTGFDWWTPGRSGAMYGWLVLGIIPGLAVVGLLSRLDGRR